MQSRALFLTFMKRLLFIVSFFYFFVPLIFHFLTAKNLTAKSPTSVGEFLTSPIFQPVLTQYYIALGKNNAMYYMAFYVCLLGVCILCWLLAYYLVRLIYLMIMKLSGR
jgi:hypothetical protein